MPTKQLLDDFTKRGSFDDLYTPEIIVKPLLEMVNFYFDLSKVMIWECADTGGSKIAKCITRDYHGFVVSTDIKTGHDFLLDDPKIDFDLIITNPPYSIKDKFIKRCYELGKPFALLLPITALEGVNRGRLYDKYGLSVMVIDSRVDFTGKGNNWFNVSWFMSGIGERNKLYFRSLKDYN